MSDIQGKQEDPLRVSAGERGRRWHIGAMNDGLFIIDVPPSPAGTDVPPRISSNGPLMVLNVVALTQERVQAIVDAHNAVVDERNKLRAALVRMVDCDDPEQLRGMLEVSKAARALAMLARDKEEIETVDSGIAALNILLEIRP